MVGVEGHNPSGHCLIASNIIDYVPLPVTSSEQHPTKRQALDGNLQSTNSLQDTPEVSLVCKISILHYGMRKNQCVCGYVLVCTLYALILLALLIFRNVAQIYTFALLFQMYG